MTTSPNTRKNGYGPALWDLWQWLTFLVDCPFRIRCCWSFCAINSSFTVCPHSIDWLQHSIHDVLSLHCSLWQRLQWITRSSPSSISSGKCMSVHDCRRVQCSLFWGCLWCSGTSTIWCRHLWRFLSPFTSTATRRRNSSFNVQSLAMSFILWWWWVYQLKTIFVILL